jgi:predicted metal-dependent hydrolase
MDTRISYTIQRSKRTKSVRLRVYGDGSVFVSLPHKAPDELAHAFVEKKIEWIQKTLCRVAARPRLVAMPWKGKTYAAYKSEAAHALTSRLSELNSRYKLPYKQVSIRNQRTRWGSCSRQGNLNFNYRLHFLPSEIRDYVLVHELCHLQEFNHSRHFWALVAQVIPNFWNLRKALLQYRLT